jgi:hypothetical protein
VHDVLPVEDALFSRIGRHVRPVDEIPGAAENCRASPTRRPKQVSCSKV